MGWSSVEHEGLTRTTYAIRAGGATWFAKTLHHSGGRVMWAVVGTKHYTGTGDTLAEAQLAALATLARGLSEDVREEVSDQAAWALAQVTQDLVALLGVTSMEVT